jgi:hypothetical protein
MAIRSHHSDGIAPTPDYSTDFLDLSRHHETGEVVDSSADAIGETLTQASDGQTEVARISGRSCTDCTMSMLRTGFPAVEGDLPADAGVDQLLNVPVGGRVAHAGVELLELVNRGSWSG